MTAPEFDAILKRVDPRNTEQYTLYRVPLDLELAIKLKTSCIRVQPACGYPTIPVLKVPQAGKLLNPFTIPGL